MDSKQGKRETNRRGEIMLKAVFSRFGEEIELTDELWQYDFGQKIQVTGIELPDVCEVHFQYDNLTETKTVTGYKQEDALIIDIPNEALTSRGIIKLYIYLVSSEEGRTVNVAIMHVNRRMKPEGFEVPEDIDLFHHTLLAANEYMQQTKSAKKSAETAADRAESARKSADADKEAAEAAQAKAEAAQKAAENAETEAKKAQTATETAKTAVETMQSTVAGYADNAKNAKESAETARSEAETAKNDAVQAKDAAEKAKSGTAADREVAEAASKAAQVSAVSAEKSAERAETAKEEIQESADQIQKNAIEIDSLKENKITKPAEAPTIGKIIRVKSVNEDGTFICEWADGASDLDVQINGESIVQNGIAEIPITQKNKQYGLFCILNNYNLLGFSNDNNLPIIKIATERNISNRDNINSLGVGGVIDSCNFDKTVKAAMCDGKGTAWTAEEQAAARERMGIYDWEDILDVTLEEDGAVNLDLNGTFKDLYLYINQSNVKTPITGNTFLIPYCANDSGYFNAYYPPTTTAFKDIAAIWYYNENITYRYACVSNAQKESTGTQTAYLKVWDKNNRTDSKIYPSGAFIGLNGLTVWKAKTRIVVKGVRA